MSVSRLAARMLIESGPDKGREFSVHGTMRIGRSGENEIAIKDPQVSRHHADISREASGYCLEDLNSVNGTMLNGQKIEGIRHLKDGDRIQVGNTTLVFHWMPTPTPVPIPNASDPTPPTTAPWFPGSGPDWAPEQPETKKLAARLPVILVVLGTVLLSVSAIALYVVLAKPDLALTFLGGQRTPPPVATMVVTDAPAEVVTMVVTSPPEPTVAPPPSATSASEPVTVRLAPDGSGDYADLEAAVAAVPPGSSILLDPGTYRLAGTLEIDKALSLKGAGMDETTIAGTTAEKQMVYIVGEGAFAAEGITFRYQGTFAARVMLVEDGEIEIVGCRFAGGVWNEEEKTGGDGLLLRGSTTGSIRDSRFEENELHGIELQDQSQPVLEGNTLTNNGENGIAYFADSGGLARLNVCSGNGLHGIGVNEQAQPGLEENICNDNEQVGIRYSGRASGLARGNECTGNGLHGISVRDEAQPALEENVCSDNQEVGIRYLGSASGVARLNTCASNGLHGISVRDQAQPVLEENVCNDNLQGSGIVYFDSAGGVARKNTCVGNKRGIYVGDTANPDLVDNDCRGNSKADVEDRRLPAEPSFGSITLAKGKTEDNEPIDATTSFPSGTKTVYALFDHKGMGPEVEWTRIWYRDGEEYVSKTETWDNKEEGTYSLWLYRTNGDPLVPATYELRLFISGNLVQTATFAIEE